MGFSPAGGLSGLSTGLTISYRLAAVSTTAEHVCCVCVRAASERGCASALLLETLRCDGPNPSLQPQRRRVDASGAQLTTAASPQPDALEGLLPCAGAAPNNSFFARECPKTKGGSFGSRIYIGELHPTRPPNPN